MVLLFAKYENYEYNAIVGRLERIVPFADISNTNYYLLLTMFYQLLSIGILLVTRVVIFK